MAEEPDLRIIPFIILTGWLLAAVLPGGALPSVAAGGATAHADCGGAHGGPETATPDAAPCGHSAACCAVPLFEPPSAEASCVATGPDLRLPGAPSAVSAPSATDPPPPRA